MGKIASEATQLRQAKSLLATKVRYIASLEGQNVALSRRAALAEKDAAEWKERFDVLLRRSPMPPKD